MSVRYVTTEKLSTAGVNAQYYSHTEKDFNGFPETKMYHMAQPFIPRY